MRLWVSLLAIATACSSSGSRQEQPERGPWRVTEVSILGEIRVADARGERKPPLRLVGVRFPPDELPVAAAARDAVRALVGDREVAFEVVESASKRGEHVIGADLVTLSVGGADLASELVRRGWVRPRDGAAPALLALEKKAREAGVGGWSAEQRNAVRDWLRQRAFDLPMKPSVAPAELRATQWQAALDLYQRQLGFFELAFEAGELGPPPCVDRVIEARLAGADADPVATARTLLAGDEVTELSAAGCTTWQVDGDRLRRADGDDRISRALSVAAEPPAIVWGQVERVGPVARSTSDGRGPVAIRGAADGFVIAGAEIWFADEAACRAAVAEVCVDPATPE